MHKKRSLLVAGVVYAASFGFSSVASAGEATYPNRPVRWIVPYPPAGTTDILARIISQWLTPRLGQQFVVDNRPGGGNNIKFSGAKAE